MYKQNPIEYGYVPLSVTESIRVYRQHKAKHKVSNMEIVANNKAIESYKCAVKLDQSRKPS